MDNISYNGIWSLCFSPSLAKKMGSYFIGSKSSSSFWPRFLSLWLHLLAQKAKTHLLWPRPSNMTLATAYLVLYVLKNVIMLEFEHELGMIQVPDEIFKFYSKWARALIKCFYAALEFIRLLSRCAWAELKYDLKFCTSVANLLSISNSNLYVCYLLKSVSSNSLQLFLFGALGWFQLWLELIKVRVKWIELIVS